MRSDRGFSLVEVLAVVAFIAIIGAVAMPVYSDIVDSMRLGQSTRDVERELQTARLKAVSTNRRLRLRTNCPTAGQFRIVQVLGTTADGPLSRCSEATYPLDTATQNPVTKRQDGPIRRLQRGVTISTDTFEFRPNGTVFQVSSSGTPEAIDMSDEHGEKLTLTKDGKTKEIWINALGKIRIVQ
jgi:prepilin-type N-terminal cleavage/methylation domain-containing protein